MKCFKNLPAYIIISTFTLCALVSCQKESASLPTPQQNQLSESEEDVAPITKTTDLTGTTRLALRPNAKDGQDTYVTFWNGDSEWANSTGDWAEELAMDSWTIEGLLMGVRSFIRFDRIDLIPAGANIISAKLCLSAKGSSISAPQGNSGQNVSKIERVTGGTWDETSLTWNTQPAVTSENAAFIPKSTSVWDYDVTVDVTNMVKAMAADPAKNYGFRISLVNENIFRSLIFASSENESAKLRPKLIIKYN